MYERARQTVSQGPPQLLTPGVEASSNLIQIFCKENAGLGGLLASGSY